MTVADKRTWSFKGMVADCGQLNGANAATGYRHSGTGKNKTRTNLWETPASSS